MSDPYAPREAFPPGPGAYQQQPYTQPYGMPPAAGYGTPVPYGHVAPVGRVRGTGTCMLLFFVTLGIYGLVWYYLTHDEMKRHTGNGIGGGVALVIALFAGIVSPFLTSHEVGQLYRRRGQQEPVTAATALWYFPGVLLLVLPMAGFRLRPLLRPPGSCRSIW